MTHIPVLLKETIAVLDPKPGEFFIDGTVGNGGHSAAILEKMRFKGKLLAVDWDEAALNKTKKEIETKFQIPNSKFQIFWVHGNYADLPEILERENLSKADGLLLDLGMSSEQLGYSGRPSAGEGFSFLRNEPLIMRYDRDINKLTAAEIINSFNEKDLAEIFYKYGEERLSRRIAQKIVAERRKKRILTTFDLVEIIKKSAPENYEKGRIHPATRVFQALRIYVNSELENLEKFLKNLDKIFPLEAGRSLAEKPKGRVVIISFHSLEDRLVKNYFREMAKQGKVEILTRKPITPSMEEIKANPRSRSAKLRAAKLL